MPDFNTFSCILCLLHGVPFTPGSEWEVALRNGFLQEVEEVPLLGRLSQVLQALDLKVPLPGCPQQGSEEEMGCDLEHGSS